MPQRPKGREVADQLNQLTEDLKRGIRLHQEGNKEEGLALIKSVNERYATLSEQTATDTTELKAPMDALATDSTILDATIESKDKTKH